jgi:hypothetical protein
LIIDCATPESEFHAFWAEDASWREQYFNSLERDALRGGRVHDAAAYQKQAEWHAAKSRENLGKSRATRVSCIGKVLHWWRTGNKSA